MLHLLLGGNLRDREKRYGDRYIGLTQYYFNDYFDSKWMLTHFTKTVVKAIDNCEVLGENVVLCPIFGAKSPTTMSTGVKTLILLDNLDLVVSGERIGDNCWKYVFELAETKDIFVCLNHTVHPKWWPSNIQIYLENSNAVWSGTYYEYLMMSCEVFKETRELGIYPD